MGTRRLRFLPFSSHSQNLCKSCSPNHIFSRSPSAHGDLEVAGRVKKGARNRPQSASRIRGRARNCPRALGGLVLATPDELGDDNMIEIKLRSRLTTSETHSRHHRNIHIQLRDFMSRRHHRADTTGQPEWEVHLVNQKANHSEGSKNGRSHSFCICTHRIPQVSGPRASHSQG